jgi:hypothetical protein
LETPNIFGSWPAMMVRARPMMKPFITGSEMKEARNPNRARPATRARTPVTTARAAVRLTKSDVPLGARSPTMLNDSAADADIEATTRCRDEPNTAYRSNAGTAA